MAVVARGRGQVGWGGCREQVGWGRPQVSSVAEVELLLDFIKPLVQDVGGAVAEPGEVWPHPSSPAPHTLSARPAVLIVHGRRQVLCSERRDQVTS